MFDPNDDDLIYDAAWEDRENLLRELHDEDGEECLTAAERNPSMLR